MRDAAIVKTVQDICARDRRYRPECYFFILDALEFTSKLLQKTARTGKERHVGGRELLEGIRHFAIQEFGPMALRVLNTWGLLKTEDIGEIVFNLVETGKLRKTDQDSRLDFATGYDFTEAFAVPFLPASRAGTAQHPAHRPTTGPTKRKSTPPDPPTA